MLTANLPDCSGAGCLLPAGTNCNGNIFSKTRNLAGSDVVPHRIGLSNSELSSKICFCLIVGLESVRVLPVGKGILLEIGKNLPINVPHINNFGQFLIFLECPCKEADWSNQIIDQSNRFLRL